MLKKYTILFFSLAILFNGCATYQSNHPYSDKSTLDNINDETTNIFLIGDAGKLEENGASPIALLKLKEQFIKADQNDILFFLGDNVYQKGIPSEKSPKFEAAVNTLNAQLEVAKTFPGKVYFIPGNHDWYSGINGLKAQEKLVEKALGKNTFKPENGCPIEKVNISDDVALLIIDSQWYITNWDNHPSINDKCEFTTREDFLDEVRSEIKKAQGKITLIAIHHPMFSNGVHGGHYSFKDYMKPLPIIGNLKNIIRKTSGIVNADLYNTFYNDLRQNIIAVAQQNEKVIFLSGHEHSQQYIEADNLKQIISGSGSKNTTVKVKNNQDYGEGAKGFALLNLYKDKAVDVQFYNVELNKIAFTKTLFESQKKSNHEYNTTKKTVISASIYTEEQTTKSKSYNFLWGNRFRKYYSTPIEAKVVAIDTLKGGLTPIRKGGGTQSKTLHLENAEGKRYVLRAMKKQATQFIQAAIIKDQYIEGQFEETASERYLEDVFTGSHPYAPFTIAKLSDAIQLSHLNPKLYYVPKQNALGEYNAEFGDELYLFEEHPSDGHSELGGNNFKGTILSTFDMMREIHKSNSKTVDEKEFIKARLFDILIGDADRHQDQWRWMEYKENNSIIYRPLPRDRDLAFSRMSDGFVFSTAVRLIPQARKFRKYEPDLVDVKGFNLSGFPLDVAFLSNTDETVWQEQIAYIQSNITDEVIDETFNSLPKEVYDSTVEEIKSILKERRNNLKKIMERYLKLVQKYAVLTATNKQDYIKVENNENGQVTVRLFEKKENVIQHPYYSHTYNPDATKEIWIYALDDDDTFEVIGKSKKIKLRLIGGQNNDAYKVEKGKNVMLYDYKSKKNDVSNARKAHVRLTDNYNTNVYDYRKLRNNINQFLPMMGYNPDDGLKLGIRNTYTTYGFERNPFTSRHQLGAFYYFATNGYELQYNSEYANVINNLNLCIEANFHSPNFSLNFFGYGNETQNFDEDKGLNYNRVKVREVNIKPALLWNSNRGSKIKLGLSYESIEIHQSFDRFINEFNVLPSYVFDEVQFAGANANYSFSNADNKAYPTIGLQFNLDLGYKNNLDINNRDFTYIVPNLKIAHKLDTSGKLVLATDIKAHVNIGNGFEFYQAAAIGGTDGLRGFRNQRFTGRNSFYQNTDIRYSFGRMKTQLIPLKMGLYSGFDYGRVWQKNEDSDKWHNSYGGGFFVNAVEMLSANFGLFNSSDGLRFTFGLGFGF